MDEVRGRLRRRHRAQGRPTTRSGRRQTVARWTCNQVRPGCSVLASPDRASADGVIVAVDLDTLIAVVRTATNSSSLTAAVRSRLEAIAAVPGRVYGVTRNQKSLHIPLSMRTLSAQARRHHHTEPLIVLVLWLLAA